MKKLKKNYHPDMIQGNIIYSLLVFTIPIAISLLFQQLYNTIDVILVGHYLGEESLAAVGAASPIYVLLLAFSLGMCSGLTIVTGRSYGSGKPELLKKTIAMSIYIALGTGLFLTVIGQMCSGLFLKVTNTPDAIIHQSEDYIFTITGFIMIMIFYNLTSSWLKAIGNSIMPLIFLMFSSALNIFLDILFITQFKMGVKGAAIATVFAQSVSVFLCIIYIWKKVPSIIPDKEHFAFDFPLLKEMFELGLSMGIMNSVVSIGTLVLQSGINQMGEFIIACHTTARSIFTFVTIPITSLSNGMATFSAQNYGANKPERIRKAMENCFYASFFYALIASIFMVLFGKYLIVFISGSKNAVILENGYRYVTVMCPFFLSLGALATLRVTLQGIGYKILPLLSSVIELLVKIAFASLLLPVFHYNAVIFCEPVAWTLMAIELSISFYGNKYIKNAKKRPVGD